MKTNVTKPCNGKKIFLIIVPIIAAVMLTSFQCSEKDERKCEDVLCTMVFMSIPLKLEYPNGQPVLLDSSKVFWVNKNCYLEKELAMWNEARIWGSYAIVDDGMRKELENKQEVIRFTGYLNNEIVCERDVLVGADCCHVNYFGTEPLNQVIYNISDAVQESKFCELVNVKRIRDIIPSYNAFINTMNENLSYENKLQTIVDWFLSHNCITNARIDCILCVPTYQGNPNNSRVAFSFIENGQTVNMIMLVAGNEPYFAGFISE
jgi:hypothetical protein